LLLAANDTCKFYQHRDWSRSAPIVNAETTFAHLVGGLIDASIQAARKSGVRIEDRSDPATRNYNLGKRGRSYIAVAAKLLFASSGDRCER
jgi:hypothetical protein